MGTKQGPIMPVTTKVENAAQAYLELLASRGIDPFYGDYPMRSVPEAFSPPPRVGSSDGAWGRPGPGR